MGTSDTRWYQRVLPIVGLLTALLGLASLAVPAVREQVALSATHRPQEYAELAFSRLDGVPLVCTTRAGRVRLDFDVTSHFTKARKLVWVATAAGKRQRDTIDIAAGETVTITAVLPLPDRGGFEVTVGLPELGQALHGRCAGVS